MGDRLLAEISDLCVSFETSSGRIEAVKSLDFQLKHGETVAIVGESGSGKSVTSLGMMRLVENGGGVIDKGQGIAKLLAADCASLAEAGSRHHFSGVSGP